jgi:hypothetical protein
MSHDDAANQPRGRTPAALVHIPDGTTDAAGRARMVPSAQQGGLDGPHSMPSHSMPCVAEAPGFLCRTTACTSCKAHVGHRHQVGQKQQRRVASNRLYNLRPSLWVPAPLTASAAAHPQTVC